MFDFAPQSSHPIEIPELNNQRQHNFIKPMQTRFKRHGFTDFLSDVTGLATAEDLGKLE
jgi:hypothetical protein